MGGFLARAERFLTAMNLTTAGLEILGPWRKGERAVPLVLAGQASTVCSVLELLQYGLQT